MWADTPLTQLLNIDYPIIQAGMAGGLTTPELVAAVSHAGGLGTLGAGYMKPKQIQKAIHDIRRLTDRPFAVNLLVVDKTDCSRKIVEQMKAKLRNFETDLGPLDIDAVDPTPIDFYEQLEVVINEKVPVFSFAFGIPEAGSLKRLKANGAVTVGTATTVREAVSLEESGVDAIVAQGGEAGGHRGSFLVDHDNPPLIGTMALVPQIIDHVTLPVIASGGIMDSRGVTAAMALGASGVQLGTAFLASNESGAHPEYKKAILKSMDESTVLTKSFSGKAARGIRNRFIDEIDSHCENIPPYPVQNALTQPLRTAAKQRNDPNFMSLWAGQGSALALSESADKIFSNIIQGVPQVIETLHKSRR